MERRHFLSLSLGAAIAAPVSVAAPGSFRFVHFTDPHIQPELRAREGCEKAFEAINALNPDFSIAGGDLVFDISAEGPVRAKDLFDLYLKTIKGLNAPLYQVPGNHDVYGLSPNGKVELNDPMYGKKMYEDRIGARYSSFDHKGWHFIQLDSIGVDGRGYRGEIDPEQFDWLKNDLEKTGTKTPIVITAHIALVTTMVQFLQAQGMPNKGTVVVNTKDVLDLLSKYNVKAVLQGHTHVREVVHYNGCQYITSGAVSGGWWKGARLGHPEGFGLLTVKGDSIEWEYKTYGWKAEA